MINSYKYAILVVDDDPKLLELIQTFYMTKSDVICCVVAESVTQAILKMSNQDFDLLLIDNIMPSRTGIDYAIMLRKSLKFANLPIILMSGALEQDDVLKAIDGKVKDILVKPFSLKQLSEKVNESLRKIK